MAFMKVLARLAKIRDYFLDFTGFFTVDFLVNVTHSKKNPSHHLMTGDFILSSPLPDLDSFFFLLPKTLSGFI